METQNFRQLKLKVLVHKKILLLRIINVRIQKAQIWILHLELNCPFIKKKIYKNINKKEVFKPL